MQQALVTILQVVIGSSLGAGIVTFALNFWKAERDIRRANLERLYTAAHKYTLLMSGVSLRLRTGRFDLSEDRSELNQQFDLISVLIDLYFPELNQFFVTFRNKNQAFIVNEEEGVFRTDSKRLKEDFLDLVKEGEKLKSEIARVAHELEVFPL
jgi:hypothetical protein